MRISCFVALSLPAILFSPSAHAANIVTVAVNNPGNPADSRYVPAGVGSVGYDYRIGKYEVTNAQYVEFLNGVDPTGANTLALYNPDMASDARGGIILSSGAANGSKYEIKPGRDDNPVVGISWYDAIRFANWLHNGMASGDTENGAYTLLGGTPTPSNGSSVTRNPGAKWWLPSEDEWYKAAYHKNDGATANYWDFPTSSNVTPYSDQPPGTDAPTPSSTANVYWSDGVIDGYDDGYAVTGSAVNDVAQNYLTDVGAYTFSTSPYGTFDQAGNALEWNETPIGTELRSLRGGSWSGEKGITWAANRSFNDPTNGAIHIGFRVATIPEPSTLLLAAIAGWRLLPRRR
jgi:formylglycine-generating enzyme